MVEVAQRSEETDLGSYPEGHIRMRLWSSTVEQLGRLGKHIPLAWSPSTQPDSQNACSVHLLTNQLFFMDHNLKWQ